MAVGHSSITTCGQDKFHKTVQHQTRPGVWMLNGVVASPSSTIGIPDLNETELLQQLKRNASPFPIKWSSRSRPSPATKLTLTWDFSDEVFCGECKVSGCGMKFKGCRVKSG
jgi:hypothetical protein